MTLPVPVPPAPFSKWAWLASGTGTTIDPVIDGSLSMSPTQGWFLSQAVVDSFLQIDFGQIYSIVGVQFWTWGGTALNGIIKKLALVQHYEKKRLSPLYFFT